MLGSCEGSFAKNTKEDHGKEKGECKGKGEDYFEATVAHTSNCCWLATDALHHWLLHVLVQTIVNTIKLCYDCNKNTHT